VTCGEEAGRRVPVVFLKEETEMRELHLAETVRIAGGLVDSTGVDSNGNLLLEVGRTGLGSDYFYGSMYSTADSGGSAEIFSTLQRWLTDAAKGFQIALSDCANGAAVGAILLAPTAAGVVGGGAAGCVLNTGAGIIVSAGSKP
jgi:hypothetical protein